MIGFITEYALEMIVAFFTLWIIFINVMWAKHNPEKVPKFLHKSIKIFGIKIALIDVLVLFGYLYDIYFNIVFGTIMFMELPHYKRLTMTARMRRILVVNDGWRFKLALFICRKLVEPWDPNHCGLDDMR